MGASSHTTNLNLPIYSNPAADTFDLTEWNNANNSIENMYTEVINARDGEVNLLTKINNIDTSLADSKTQADNIKSYLALNGKHKGCCFPINFSPTTQTYKDSMTNIRNNYGADSTILSVQYDQASSTSNIMTADPENSRLDELIKHCQSLGYWVAVKIHVGSNAGDGTSLNPTDVNLWFQNYEVVCKYIASICVANNVEYLCISNELYTMTNQNRTLWQTLINNIKAQYPSIKVFCSVNKAEYATCIIFDLFDVIGFNFYPSITYKGVNETDANMKKSFFEGLDGKNLIKMLRDLKTTYKKPVWITEIGCALHGDALIDTWRYDFTDTTKYPSGYSQTAQEYYYKYIFNSVWTCSAIDGMFLWSAGSPIGSNPSSTFPPFTFEGALAGQIVSDNWGGTL